MDHNYFKSIHRELCLIEEHALWANKVVDELQSHKMEIRFLERLSQLSEKDVRTLRVIWDRGEMGYLASRLSLISKDGDGREWRVLALQMKAKSKMSKFEVKRLCNSNSWLNHDSLVRKQSEWDEILIFLDTVLNNLKDLLGCKKGNNVLLENQMETFEAELLFLQSFLRLTENCIDSEELQQLRNPVRIFAKQAVKQTFLFWANAKYEGIGRLVSHMLRKITPCTHDIRASHFGYLRYKSSTTDDIRIFLVPLVNNQKYLVIYKADKIVPFKMQIEMLERRLVFLQNILKVAAYDNETYELREFKRCVHVLAQNAACLTLECWSKAAGEHYANKLDLMLSEMPQKLKPSMPYVTDLFFGTLKAMVRSDSLLLGQTVATFLDLLLDNLSNHMKDDFQILWEDLMFLSTFVADPPNKGANDEELTLVYKKIDVLLREGSCLISSLDGTKECFSERKVFLYNFVREIELVNSKITQLYCKIPDSSSYSFPRIIGRGFLDFLIQNLTTLQQKQITDTRYLPFAKYKIIRIKEELASLRPFFNDVLEFQHEHKELNHTWLQVIDLLHLAEHVTNSCFDFDCPIWYHMAYLSAVVDRIQVVKTQIELMKESNMYKVEVLPSSATYLGKISEQARAPEISQVVGLAEEADIIIHKLTRGYKSLDIVSIVGMAGLGKTTLARKVYGTSLLKYCFNIFAFSSVSKDHSIRRLLLDILSQITLIDDDISCMTEDDLAHRLRKCLSQRKYLIVLDDIWKIRAWNELKSSFPDDQNGSRVMLTTRFQKVATEAQINCSPYTLSFLSEEKSWELLQKKVFYSGSCPEDLSAVGKLIAKKCNGLPLAVVLIAGVLAKKERSVRIWSEISERIGFYLSEEGLMEMLELSYKHLAGRLKPCLLHFGAFPEDMLISTKILMHLWIAEGFVHESETMSLMKVAKEYLKDLADRSLIIINGRSSSGGIKTIRVHDVIHKFCQMKASAENFFFLGHGTASSSSLGLPIYNHYRVFLQDGEATVDRSSMRVNARSSRGGIKRLGFHDLIHDFFLMKVESEKFFLLKEEIAESSSSESDIPMYNHYPLRLQVGLATVKAAPTFPSMHSLLCFQRCNDPFDAQTIIGRFKLYDPFDTQTIVGRFRLVQVLYLESMWLEEGDLKMLSLLLHLRHIVAPVNGLASVPSSVSNLWKLETFVLRTMMKSKVILPKTVWKMKSLRHVNISRCKLTFSGGHEHDVYPQLDNVESFSSPTLSAEKDLRELLIRLPALRKLGCHFYKPSESIDKPVETLDFHSEIESLNISYIGERSHRIPYAVIFPSTLKKLKLVGFELTWTAISDISKLPCLEVLMLHWKSVVGPRWDTEDVEFPRLKFLKMNGLNLVRWNASPDSFPCLEQLFVIGCEDLMEIPACFGEITTLKRFEVHGCSQSAASSANQIKEDQMDSGNESLECAISNSF